MKMIFSVIEPELNTMTNWLEISNNDGSIEIDEFISKFNSNSDVYRQRTVNWSEFNNAKLSLGEVRAESTGEGTSFNAYLTIDEIDIYEVSRALNVPSAVASLFSHLGEKFIAASLNTVCTINRHLLSKEAVRQLNKRGMKAEAVYVKISA